VVLGTLFVFATLVLLIHVVAVGRAAGPLRLEGLRIVADAAARDLADGRPPALAAPFGYAIVGASGEVVAGRLPLRGLPRGEPSELPRERCGEWGYWCWAVRAVPGHDARARLVVYPRFRHTEVRRLEGLAIDTTAKVVTRGGEPVDLTAMEYRILEVLSPSPGRVFSRDEILERLGEAAHAGYDRTMDSHLARLRRKIEADPREPRFIETVRGLGYRFARG
jgi:hypothetical protein